MICVNALLDKFIYYYLAMRFMWWLNALFDECESAGAREREMEGIDRTTANHIDIPRIS